MKKTYNHITVSDGCQDTQKAIHSASDWFNVEYYTIIDNNNFLIIRKCYMEIPKNAKKYGSNKSLKLISAIPNGKYEFDEDSTEDELIIYYRD